MRLGLVGSGRCIRDRCKRLTSRSLPEIGRKFGKRDHTTIMHGVRKIDELRQSDSQIADDLELLRRALEH